MAHSASGATRRLISASLFSAALPCLTDKILLYDVFNFLHDHDVKTRRFFVRSFIGNLRVCNLFS
jgi:hypothetical protein